MACTTVGILIQQIRREKKITGSKLAYGICSKQVLKDIEADQNEADILMLDILMQRMGQSPDKFEMILRRDAYYMKTDAGRETAAQLSSTHQCGPNVPLPHESKPDLSHWRRL